MDPCGSGRSCHQYRVHYLMMATVLFVIPSIPLDTLLWSNLLLAVWVLDVDKVIDCLLDLPEAQHTLSLSHTHTHSLSHTHTLSLTLSPRTFTLESNHGHSVPRVTENYHIIRTVFHKIKKRANGVLYMYLRRSRVYVYNMEFVPNFCKEISVTVES